MKHTLAGPTLAAGLLAAISLPLSAAPDLPPAETNWESVCAATGDREVTVTTGQGETIQGYCVSIDVKKMTVRTSDRRYVQIARNTLSKLEVERWRGHQLVALGRGMHRGIRWGAENMFSHRGPLPGIVIPLTLAWGATAAPFCIVGDIIADAAGKREIKVKP